MKIRSKFIFLILAVVLTSIIPISVLILWSNQKVLLRKTYDLCQTLGGNLANVSREELLINETFDTTTNAISYLRKTKTKGLLDAYVINHENRIVASLRESKTGQQIPNEDARYFRSLTELQSSKIERDGKAILRFSYPVFVRPFQKKPIRVGTVSFEFDEAVILKPIAELRNRIIRIALILLGIGILISLVVAFLFSRPIHILADGAEKLGSGDLSHRIKIKNKDELGNLAHSFNQMAEKIEDFTQNLEHKVEDRTRELNESLKQVQALKVQQDGDYFLTSLLAQPLGHNLNQSPHIQTEFLVEQKKKFHFKKWDSEIGGDLCVTDSFRIGGQDYTVFLNADAMGKSIQGAGGVLVLGAVFQAILARSKTARHQARHPEIWLRDTYMDLQNTFVSFNGSMYMSMVLGLLSPSGMLYLINTEHPFPVLRQADGTCRFIEDPVGLHKLGTPGEEKKLFITTLQIQEGDQIICGSDGRDDIRIPGPDGELVMNEDENLFLEHVSMSEGDLKKLKEILKNFGELSDDLSLLSVRLVSCPVRDTSLDASLQEILNKAADFIERGEDKKAISLLRSHFEKGQHNSEFVHLLGSLYSKHKDYRKALRCFRIYHKLEPMDEKTIYLLSYLHAQLKEWDEAIDEAERLFLRNPHYDKNLLLLAQLYLQKGILERAEHYIYLCSAENPDLPGLREVLRSIEQAREGEVTEAAPKEEIERMLNDADTYYKKKRYNKAARIYQEILNVEPKHEWAWFRLGNCRALTKEPIKALQAYSRALLLNPTNPHTRNNYATVLYKLGQTQKAKDHLKRITLKSNNGSYRKIKKNMEIIKS